MADIPESRSYRHIKCDTQTEISGQAFEVMSNPISDMTRTWCTQCDDYFPLSDYEWSDTGENVTKYYERHSSKATPLQRTLCSKKCMIVLAGIGFILGAAGGYFLFRDQALWVKIVFTPVCGGFGVFIGCAVYISAICEPITRKVCGVKDTRTLT